MDLKILLVLLAGFASVSSRNQQAKAATKSSNDQKSASSDYKTVTGPDDKGNNYIPFQWQVEIIKREYDDYVLPDGTVYRVPHGAVPPHRYKGSGPYDVPYYVFKEGKGHSGEIYGNRPKLVETFDTQTLELLQQDWYQEELWARGYLGKGDKRYPASQYYGDYDSGGNFAYAPSERHEKTYSNSAQPRQNYRSNSAEPSYFMRSYNGTRRWNDRHYSPASSRTSSISNYGSNPQIGQTNKLMRMSGAFPGRASPRRNGGENSAFPYASVPSAPVSSSTTNLKRNKNTPDPKSKVNIESDIRPNVHPFLHLFRGGLTSDHGHEKYS